MMKKILVYFIFLFLIFSCAGKVEYKKPEISLPSKKILSYDISNKWWLSYNDKYLNKLIEFALKNNDDLKLAALRIKEAEATASLEKSRRFPEISSSFSASRYRTSKEFYKIFGGEISNDFNLSADVSYETDFWQRAKNREKYAIEVLLSEKANKEIIKITLISKIIETYFSLIAISNEINIYTKIKEKIKEILDYRKIQLKHGLIDEIEIKKIESQLNEIKVTITKLKEQKIKLTSLLSTLVGEQPSQIFADSIKIATKLPKQLKIPSFIPSKLLKQRPDIIKAEKLLKAASINVAIAKTLYFPDIFLTASGGFESTQLYNLIKNSAKFWNIGAILNQTVLDFGRKKQKIKLASITEKQALVNYVKTVKVAFNEVYEGLKRYEITKKAIKQQLDTINSLKEILRISLIKYKKGATDYLPVLYNELNILEAKGDFIELKKLSLLSQVFLFKALGGGYDFHSNINY